MIQFIGIVLLIGLLAFFGSLAAGRKVSGTGSPIAWVKGVYTGRIAYERAVVDAARYLAPVWVGLIVLVFGAIFHLFWTLGDTSAEGVRFHYLAIGSMFLALGGLIAAPLAIIRVWTSERQTRTIEQGHVTDRLTKAIEQLGSEKTVKRTVTREDGTTFIDERTEPNIEVRLGAIYALERIARDSERDHISVMEILCAYVRENAADHIPTKTIRTAAPRTDIRAVLDVLSRRTEQRIAFEERQHFSPDLKYSRFSNRNLIGLSFVRVDLSYSFFERAKYLRSDSNL